jgi:Holliday junction resolvase RusA-like endonuclease
MIQYIYEGVIVPKARPRATKRGTTYMPKNYVDNQKELIELFSQQAPEKPLEKIKLDVMIYGKYPRRGDCDNITGSIMDALVKAKVIKNDNLNVIPHQSFDLFYDETLPPKIKVSLIEI